MLGLVQRSELGSVSVPPSMLMSLKRLMLAQQSEEMWSPMWTSLWSEQEKLVTS